MSKKRVEDAASIEMGEAESNRRAFLTRSGALLAALAASGVVGVEGVAAQERLTAAQTTALRDVVRKAMANGGNLDVAMRSQNARLPASTVATLKSLTRADWQAAARLNSKLGRLQNAVADTNGIIGM